MTPSQNRYYNGPVRSNYDGKRFYSPGQPLPDRSLRDLLSWQFSGSRANWPTSVAVTQQVPPLQSVAPRITMVGHATVLIQVSGVNLLTDPVWSERASPFRFAGPKRVGAPGIAFEDLPPIDAVLLSHNHYDHLDIATLRRLNETHQPLMVMPLGNDVIVRKSVPNAHIETGDWHDRISISEEITISLTPANHWSARGIGDRRMALWSGFWIDTPHSQIWFAGDTGYGDGAIFHDIRKRHGSPEIALIPIGAYAPRWFMSNQHVWPEESVSIFEDIGARQALGIHWGTFQLTDEPREEPPVLLREGLAKADIPDARFVAFASGDVLEFI